MNWTYLVVAAVLPLCACAGAQRPAPVRPAPVQPVQPVQPAPPRGTGSLAGPGSPPPAAARDGGHVAACRDGDCEVSVRSGTKIPLSRRFGMGPIAVTVDGEDVGLRAHAPETDMSDTVTAPGTVTLNDITVDVIDAHDGVVTLRISHH